MFTKVLTYGKLKNVLKGACIALGECDHIDMTREDVRCHKHETDGRAFVGNRSVLSADQLFLHWSFGKDPLAMKVLQFSECIDQSIRTLHLSSDTVLNVP